MRDVKFFALVPILTFAVIGCAPDLVVRNLDVAWDANNKTATAEIANIGNKNAGGFMVYFDVEEDPASQNHIPQVRHNVPFLVKGNSIILEADFAPLAHPDNSNLGNVYKILVLADSKGMIKESNENNNQMEFPVSSGSQESCIDFEQQVLSTVYNVGDVFTEDGVTITMRDFVDGGGGVTATGEATIENSLQAGHAGQELAVNNINVSFRFGGSNEGISLFFGEYGGNLNIRVNGDFRNFDNFVDINGAIIGGATVAVVNGLGNDMGTLTLSGTVEILTIGGQELWIDHVCRL